MDNVLLSELCEPLQAELIGADTRFSQVSTDTRNLPAGSLFIALTGPKFNGHDFIAAAQKSGAAAVVVSEPVTTSLPCLKVKDTRVAYGQLATFWRQQRNIPVIAITGSMGKTTTKELLANILRNKGDVLATQANENNDIGVPLTLLRCHAQHQFAVIEIGADKFGEIDYAVNIAQPNIAVLTGAAPVHLDGFGDLMGVAHGKGEIFNGLQDGGVAVINQDDTYADYWKRLVNHHRVVTFGSAPHDDHPPDVTARHIELKEGMPHFTLVTPQGETTVQLQLLGQHNVTNALAAAAAAYAADMPLAEIKQGLETTQPYQRRLVKRRGINNASVIDDTYNASPQAMTAALQVLAEQTGEKILIVGDMLELAKESESYHTQVGEQAKQLGVDKLYAMGELSRLVVDAFGGRGQHFANHDDLINAVKQGLHEQSVVLVKGSNSSNMGTVATALIEQVEE